MQKNAAKNNTETFNVQPLAMVGMNPVVVGDQFPTEFKVLSFGANATLKGDVRVTAKTRDLLPRLQRTRGFDRVALDFEHNTLPGTPAYVESTEPRAVAAYGVPQLRADGLWLGELAWTPNGRKSARDYIDLSPAPELDTNGDVIFLHSVALCRQGAVDGLNAGFYSVTVPLNSNNNDTNSEDALMEKIMALLKKALSLADTATDADLEKALTALCAKIKDIETKVVALSAGAGSAAGNKGTAGANADGEKGAPGSAAIAALTAKLDDVVGKVKAFDAAIEKRDRDELVAQACREGKVVPLTAEQIASTPVATLRDMIKALAVTVPIDQRTPVNVQHFSATGAGALTEQDKKLAATFGFTEDQVKKANNLR